MKKKLSYLFATTVTVLALSALFLAPGQAKEKPPRAMPSGEAGPADSAGSIRPAGKLSATKRAALARITFQQAFRVAVTARPGKVIYCELEVDDGNLDFDFEIIGASGNVIEVQVDAGNGKVLAIDDNADDV